METDGFRSILAAISSGEGQLDTAVGTPNERSDDSAPAVPGVSAVTSLLSALMSAENETADERTSPASVGQVKPAHTQLKFGTVASYAALNEWLQQPSVSRGDPPAAVALLDSANKTIPRSTLGQRFKNLVLHDGTAHHSKEGSPLKQILPIFPDGAEEEGAGGVLVKLAHILTVAATYSTSAMSSGAEDEFKSRYFTGRPGGLACDAKAIRETFRKLGADPSKLAEEAFKWRDIADVLLGDEVHVILRAMFPASFPQILVKGEPVDPKRSTWIVRREHVESLLSFLSRHDQKEIVAIKAELAPGPPSCIKRVFRCINGGDPGKGPQEDPRTFDEMAPHEATGGNCPFSLVAHCGFGGDPRRRGTVVVRLKPHAEPFGTPCCLQPSAHHGLPASVVEQLKSLVRAGLPRSVVIARAQAYLDSTLVLFDGRLDKFGSGDHDALEGTKLDFPIVGKFDVKGKRLSELEDCERELEAGLAAIHANPAIIGDKAKHEAAIVLAKSLESRVVQASKLRGFASWRHASPPVDALAEMLAAVTTSQPLATIEDVSATAAQRASAAVASTGSSEGPVLLADDAAASLAAASLASFSLPVMMASSQAMQIDSVEDTLATTATGAAATTVSVGIDSLLKAATSAAPVPTDSSTTLGGSGAVSDALQGSHEDEGLSAASAPSTNASLAAPVLAMLAGFRSNRYSAVLRMILPTHVDAATKSTQQGLGSMGAASSNQRDIQAILDLETSNEASVSIKSKKDDKGKKTVITHLTAHIHTEAQKKFISDKDELSASPDFRWRNQGLNGAMFGSMDGTFGLVNKFRHAMFFVATHPLTAHTIPVLQTLALTETGAENQLSEVTANMFVWLFFWSGLFRFLVMDQAASNWLGLVSALKRILQYLRPQAELLLRTLRNAHKGCTDVEEKAAEKFFELLSSRTTGSESFPSQARLFEDVPEGSIPAMSDDERKAVEAYFHPDIVATHPRLLRGLLSLLVTRLMAAMIAAASAEHYGAWDAAMRPLYVFERLITQDPTSSLNKFMWSIILPKARLCIFHILQNLVTRVALETRDLSSELQQKAKTLALALVFSRSDAALQANWNVFLFNFPRDKFPAFIGYIEQQLMSPRWRFLFGYSGRNCSSLGLSTSNNNESLNGVFKSQNRLQGTVRGFLKAFCEASGADDTSLSIFAQRRQAIATSGTSLIRNHSVAVKRAQKYTVPKLRDLLNQRPGELPFTTSYYYNKAEGLTYLCFPQSIDDPSAVHEEDAVAQSEDEVAPEESADALINTQPISSVASTTLHSHIVCSHRLAWCTCRLGLHAREHGGHCYCSHVLTAMYMAAKFGLAHVDFSEEHDFRFAMGPRILALLQASIAARATSGRGPTETTEPAGRAAAGAASQERSEAHKRALESAHQLTLTGAALTSRGRFWVDALSRSGIRCLNEAGAAHVGQKLAVQARTAGNLLNDPIQPVAVTPETAITSTTGRDKYYTKQQLTLLTSGVKRPRYSTSTGDASPAGFSATEAEESARQFAIGIIGAGAESAQEAALMSMLRHFGVRQDRAFSSPYIQGLLRSRICWCGFPALSEVAADDTLLRCDTCRFQFHSSCARRDRKAAAPLRWTCGDGCSPTAPYARESTSSRKYLRLSIGGLWANLTGRELARQLKAKIEADAEQSADPILWESEVQALLKEYSPQKISFAPAKSNEARSAWSEAAGRGSGIAASASARLPGGLVAAAGGLAPQSAGVSGAKSSGNSSSSSSRGHKISILATAQRVGQMLRGKA